MRIGWLDGIRGHWDNEDKYIRGGKLVFVTNCRVSVEVNTWNWRQVIEGREQPRPTIDCYGAEFYLTPKQKQKIRDTFQSVVNGTSRLKTAITTL